MSQHGKYIGGRGEDFVDNHLRKLGYRVVDRNYHCRYGELDIVAKKDDEFVFVEVKTRTNFMFGTPEEAVDRRKQKKLIRAVAHYLQRCGQADAMFRIDVAGLYIDPRGKVLLNYIENAVEDVG